MPKKKPTAAERRHMGLVASFGCIACRNIGYPDTPAELHHPRKGVGMALRADHKDVIPLCHTHHRTGGYGVAIHAGRVEWEKKHGTEAELLAQTQELVESFQKWNSSGPRIKRSA